MKTTIKKFNSRTWEWSITSDNGTPIKGGFAASKSAAETDARIVLGWIEKDEAKANGRIAAGDEIRIKPEWMDKGDENFTFIAYDTQLEGMKSIRVQGRHKSDGKLAVGLQSVDVSMIERS